MNSMNHDDCGPGNPISVPSRELFFLSYIRENSKGTGFLSISSLFSGEAHVRWRGYSASSTLLFFGSPTYTSLTSDESLWEAEIPPH